MKRGDMLHVANHTSYHRGLIADLLPDPVRPPAPICPCFCGTPLGFD
jgi:hypothetical protein